MPWPIRQQLSGQPHSNCLNTSETTGSFELRLHLPSQLYGHYPNAVCAPTQMQVNTGLVGCAIAVANISTGTAYADALLRYPASQHLSHRRSLWAAPAPQPAKPSTCTTRLRQLLGGGAMRLQRRQSRRQASLLERLERAFPQPLCLPRSTHQWTGGTLVPPALGGGFVVPCGVSGPQTVTMTEANSTPQAGTISAHASLTVVPGTTPAITSINPTRGPSGGGTTVTINGCNFTGATSVTFGGVQAKSFSVNAGGTSISAVSPAGRGTVNVVVTGPGGHSGTSIATQFSYGFQGYDMAGADGGVFAFGDAHYHGSLPALGVTPNKPIVGMALTADGGGYWQVGSDGGVYAFGDAHFHGSMGGTPLNQPVVGMAATPDGGGYWLVAADGGIFAFGNAVFHGSMGGKPLNKPIVGMTATPDGGGYWLVASDGGIFAFGDAHFHGSMGGTPLNQPIAGIASPDGGGYWLVAADGGIFAFGDAGYHGSLPALSVTPNRPIVSIVSSDPGGYWEIGSDGGVYSFGDATFFGSLGAITLALPIAAATLA